MDYGWFAHPLFKDKHMFNTGLFNVKLWKPPPFLDAPYELNSMDKMDSSLTFTMIYKIGKQTFEDPID
jgi:hypothetical protein